MTCIIPSSVLEMGFPRFPPLGGGINRGSASPLLEPALKRGRLQVQQPPPPPPPRRFTLGQAMRGTDTSKGSRVAPMLMPATGHATPQLHRGAVMSNASPYLLCKSSSIPGVTS